MLLYSLALAAEPGDYLWNPHNADTTSPGYQLALQLSEDNARVYGAAGIMERKLIPALSGFGEPGTVITFETNALYGVATIPYHCAENSIELTTCPVTEAADRNLYVDIHSMGVGAGVRGEWLGVFYAGSFQIVPVMDGLERWGFPQFVEILYSPVLMLPGSFLLIEAMREPLGIGGLLPYGELIGGVSAFSPAVDLYAAYSVSGHVYTNVTQATARAFLTSVLDPRARDLPFLRTGFDQFPWESLVSGSEAFGNTSAFVRKVSLPGDAAPLGGATSVTGTASAASVGQLGTVSAKSFGEAAGAAAEDLGANLWSGHLQEHDIVGIVDVNLAYSWKPDRRFQEFTVAGHFPRTDIDNPSPVTVLVQAGFVDMPAVPAFDIEGGRTLQAKLQLLGGTEEIHGRIGLFYNDADTLATFPYARNHVQVQMGFDAAFGK